MSEEKGDTNNTSQGRVTIPKSQKTSSQSGGHGPRLIMDNQDTKLWLPMFHGMSKDDVEKHWFMCEDIWFVKRIIEKALKIV